MNLPPYTKTAIGVLCLLGAALALKLKIITIADAGSAAMVGLTLMGIGVRGAVAQIPQAIADQNAVVTEQNYTDWDKLKKGE